MSNKIISSQASRLKKIRLYMGMTRKQFGEKLGISQYTLRSWENGHKPFIEKSVVRVSNALNKKLNFKCQFDWLMNGLGKSPISIKEEYQRSENDIKLDNTQDNILKEIVTFKSLNNNAEVIAVTTDFFEPLAGPGDYIGFIKINKKQLENFIGRFIFITDNNEDKCFGNLAFNSKSKSYTIAVLNKETQEIIKEHHELFVVIWFRKLIQE